jgi:hypothetical protein
MVTEHPMYAALETLEHVRRFQSRHVFAVWDFMSLLKRLQRELTCVEIPWRPVGDPDARRFVNEIVLEEESGSDRRGGFASHFELYRASMDQTGADTTAIDAFCARLDAGDDVGTALAEGAICESVRSFVGTTWSLVADAPVHCVAAAFTMAREDLIPEMFRRLLGELAEVAPDRLEGLRDYFELHVEVDGESHGPLALRLLSSLCGDDPGRWREAQSAARDTLTARAGLWDGVLEAVGSTEPGGSDIARSTRSQRAGA